MDATLSLAAEGLLFVLLILKILKNSLIVLFFICLCEIISIFAPSLPRAMVTQCIEKAHYTIYSALVKLDILLQNLGIKSDDELTLFVFVCHYDTSTVGYFM